MFIVSDFRAYYICRYVGKFQFLIFIHDTGYNCVNGYTKGSELGALEEFLVVTAQFWCSDTTKTVSCLK